MLRRWRLITGLTLFTFLATHLLNHALGLGGRDWLAAGRGLFLALWRNPLGEGLLLAALLVHLALAGVALYRRTRLHHLRPWEAAQLLLGLVIPPLITVHVVGTAMAHYRFGLDDSYDYLYLLFAQDLSGALRQGAAALIAWTHGCIGLWFWLRLKSWFPPWRDIILAALVLLPTLSLAGVAVGIREVAWLAEDPAWREARLAASNPLDAAGWQWLYATERWLLATYALLLGGVLAARGWRGFAERRGGQVRITYPGGLAVAAPRGFSILEASQLRRVPHAAVCGGRGRCSTCRVRVLRGLENLPPPSVTESRVLARIGAGGEVRLACQARPTGNLEVEPLLPPGATPRDALPRPGYLQGQEREVAVLFADLRGFTRLSEGRLPYDVVFLLNRYFRGMAHAVEGAGGQIDKFLGDGVMALFGLRSDSATGCRQALAAARAMALELADMNRALQHDLQQPLRIGMGLHVGPCIVGEMGAGRAVSVTAIGDTVNTASRLENLSKEFAAELVLSVAVAEKAGLDLSWARREETVPRGRETPLSLLVVEQAATLPKQD